MTVSVSSERSRSNMPRPPSLSGAKPPRSPVAVPTFSTGGLMQVGELQALRRRRDIQKDLRVAYGHCEAYQAGGGGQLIGWLDCLMTGFAETCAYRDLYMLVEKWEGSGGRLDVLDCLRRLMQLAKSVSHTLLTQFIKPLEDAFACPTATKFLRLVIDQHALLIQRHVTGFRLQAEWLANARHRAQYIRNAKIQMAKDAVFLQTGNPTPGRFCEAGYEDRWGYQAWRDWKVKEEEKKRIAQREKAKPKKRIKIASDPSFSEEDSEIDGSHISTADMGSLDQRAKARNSDLGTDQPTMEAITQYEDSMKSSVAESTGLVTHEIEGKSNGRKSKETTESSSEASTLAERIPPPVEDFHDRCDFINHYFMGGTGGGSPEESYARWNAIRETAAMLCGKEGGKFNHHEGKVGERGKRLKPTDDGDSVMDWRYGSPYEGRTTPATSKGKKVDEDSLAATLSITLGSLGNRSEINGATLGSVLSVGGSKPPGTREKSGLTRTALSGHSNITGSDVSGSGSGSGSEVSGSGSGDSASGYVSRSGSDSVNTRTTSDPSIDSVSLSNDGSLSLDSQSTASKESLEMKIWNDHMRSKGSDTLPNGTMDSG